MGILHQDNPHMEIIHLEITKPYPPILNTNIKNSSHSTIKTTVIFFSKMHFSILYDFIDQIVLQGE